MTTVVLAGLAAYGVHLVFTALAHRWSGIGPGPRRRRARPRRRVDLGATLERVGLDDVRPAEFAATTLAVATVAGTLTAVVLGGLAPALVVAAFAATFPAASARLRREQRRAAAAEAWPRMIEEIRLRVTTLGRSIPQALFEVGERAPEPLRPAFEAARREWLLTTDLAHATAVLKRRLDDPTADATCETLLVAHEIGGADVGSRLEALAEDRRLDLQGRKDARAEQAGARFARRFVLIVPLGMAIVGLQIGDGRAAYRSGAGQAVAVLAVALVIACWWWAGRIMRLPDERRVLTS
ncbi:MAG TPA: hypothetical protein VK866_06570 [Acidimicrobiales bacterium]|nr:hypothetical protein [Acidimicrobiales bacterium]